VVRSRFRVNPGESAISGSECGFSAFFQTISIPPASILRKPAGNGLNYLDDVFSDTDKELPETYEYLERIEAFLGKKIVKDRFMRSWLLLLILTIAAAALWALLVLVGCIEGWGRQRLAPPGNVPAFESAATDQIKSNNRGNIAFILLGGGQRRSHFFASVGQAVDGDSRFQVASLSKWVSAWGVLSLVDAGKVDLDAPVGTYLSRWKLPESEFDNSGVTVRRLLSHTAGLTDGLGYAGFAPGREPQSLEGSLTQAVDASPRADGRVRVGIAPGTKWEYSGGGYTLLQLLIEEVSGLPFESYMRNVVLLPLGMTRSTYVIPEGEDDNLAESYDSKGATAPLFRFTSLAATSLYTTTSDLTLFLQAHLPGPDGAPSGRGVLKPATLSLMRQPHASQFGADIWGLGTMLFTPNNKGDFIIGHDGSNEPAINTTARLDPSTGDGIIILESGDPLLATRLAGEWVFWHTGNLDFLMVMMNARRMMLFVAVGWIVILLTAIIVGWRLRRARQQ